MKKTKKNKGINSIKDALAKMADSVKHVAAKDSFKKKKTKKPFALLESVRSVVETSKDTLSSVMSDTFAKKIEIGKKILPSVSESKKKDTKVVARPIVHRKSIIDTSKDTISTISDTFKETIEIGKEKWQSAEEFWEELWKMSENVSDKYLSDKGKLNVRDAARIAAHVYGDCKNTLLQNGWTENLALGHNLKEILNLTNDLEQLKAKLYSRDINGRREYVYAFAGTSDLSDWGDNLGQMVGLSRDYKRAIDAAKTLSASLPNDKLFFVGHSKGGGEAALCSIVTGRPAVVFNPAFVSNISKIRYKRKNTNHAPIDVYVLKKDPLYLVHQGAKSPFSIVFPRFKAVLATLGTDIDGDIHELESKTKLPLLQFAHKMHHILAALGIDLLKYKRTSNKKR